MTDIWNWLFRGIAALSGSLVLAATLLLYEDEEGNVQSRLEEWWIRIDDLQRSALSKHLRFMAAITRMTDQILNRIFGHQILSLKAAGISGCCSVGAAGFLALAASLDEPDMIGFSILLILIPLILVVGALRWKTLEVVPFVAVLVILGCLLYEYIFPTPSLVNLRLELAVTFSIVISIVLSVLFVAVARKLLRFGADAKTYGRMVAGFAGTASLPVILAIPSLLAIKMPQPNLPVIDDLYLGFILAPIMSIPLALISILLFLLAGAMLIHRSIWPLPNRLLYMIQRHHIVERKAMLWKLGVGMLAVAATPIGYFLSSVAQALGFE